MNIEGAGAVSTLAFSHVAKDRAQGAPQTAEAQLDKAAAGSSLLASIRVTLSAMGQARSAEDKGNRDIEQSDLPGQIKQLLIRMRELRQQIEQTQRELLELLGSTDLRSIETQAKADALRAELNTLSSALQQLSTTLLETMAQAGLTKEQEQQVASLILG